MIFSIAVHRPIRRLLISGLLLIGGFALRGQDKIGFFMPEGVKYVEVEFELYSNLIVIPIEINKRFTLKFILDTGAESAILTEKVFGDFLGLNYVRDITLQGPGVIDSLQAFVATDVRMSLPGGIKGRGLNMLVLKEDYLQLTKNLGEEIYGILGYDLFNRFVIKIDYDRRKLRIYDPKYFSPGIWDTKIPMSVKGTKPYINLKVGQGSKEDSVCLMVDSGASHSLLLDVSHTDDISLPGKVIETRLGQGLGGEIPGYMGRIDQVELNKFSFEEVLVSIPRAGTYLKAIKRGSRHGTLGGELLSRFEVTFDYPRECMYLNKGHNFNEKFEANMSGVFLAAFGQDLDSLVVSCVDEHTPAHETDIRVGDHVLKVNGLNLENSSVSEIHALLRKKQGLKIKMWIYRDGEKIKKIFKLQRLI